MLTYRKFTQMTEAHNEIMRWMEINGRQQMVHSDSVDAAEQTTEKNATKCSFFFFFSSFVFIHCHSVFGSNINADQNHSFGIGIGERT